MRFVLGTIMTASALIGATLAWAGDCGCAGGHNGCCDPCGGGGCDDSCCDGGKRCELKIGKKKIKVVCYGCECAEVCLPCPSIPGCKHCEDVCDGCCDSCDPCACDSHCNKKPVCKVRWREWCPDGAQMYHIKKLVKYEVEKEVPDYKWVVVDCCAAGAAAPAPAGDVPPVPPVPKPASSVTRRVPKGAKVGQSFPLSKEEIEKYVTNPVLPVSHVVPASTPVQKSAPAKSSQPSKDQLPWSLFTK
jgi:hypothetical protein